MNSLPSASALVRRFTDMTASGQPCRLHRHPHPPRLLLQSPQPRKQVRPTRRRMASSNRARHHTSPRHALATPQDAGRQEVHRIAFVEHACTPGLGELGQKPLNNAQPSPQVYRQPTGPHGRAGTPSGNRCATRRDRCSRQSPRETRCFLHLLPGMATLQNALCHCFLLVPVRCGLLRNELESIRHPVGDRVFHGQERV